MSYKLLAHNLLGHPLAGLLWYLADKLAAPSLEALGAAIHDRIFPANDYDQRERWLAEFNLVFYGRGYWSLADIQLMSDEQLAFTLEALHRALALEHEAMKASTIVVNSNTSAKLDAQAIERVMARAHRPKEL